MFVLVVVSRQHVTCVPNARDPTEAHLQKLIGASSLENVLIGQLLVRPRRIRTSKHSTPLNSGGKFGVEHVDKYAVSIRLAYHA